MNFSKFDSAHFLQIRLASSDEIKNWAEGAVGKSLVCREVKKPDTLNYRSFRPEKDGLFCERIFGPIHDWMCSCGQVKEQKFAVDHEKALTGVLKTKICPVCQVEVTTSRFRRYRMGYIDLACPVTHIWYVNARPNLFSLLLKMPTKYMKKIIYYKAYSPSLGLPEYLSACLSPGGDFFDNEWEYLHNWLAGKESSADISSPWNLQARLQSTTISELASLDEEQSSLGSQRKHTTFPDLTDKDHAAIHGFTQQASKKMPEFPNWLKNTGAKGLLNELESRNWKKEIEKLLQDLGPETLMDSFDSSDQLQSTKTSLMSEPGTAPKFSDPTDKDHAGNLSSEPTILTRNQDEEMNLLIDEDLVPGKMSIGIDPADIEIDGDESSDFVGKRRKNRLRRLKILQTFQKSGLPISSLIFSTVPVLPPDLRPIIQLGPGQIASSDVNDLYRRILIRNNRLKYYLYETHFVEFLVRSEQQLVQLAVDALLENGKTTQVRHTTGQKRLYKSLTERIGGKQGRFRMNLLGKRVDYSGRSVIVVGPALHLSQCGIPYEMGLELFQAFLLRFLLEFQIAKTLRAAKNILTHNKPFARQLLHRILQSYPVLLNRAPTLHRLGIQAFQPVLSFGRALRLHPLVCPAFNADFDGDQMAVHVPLSPQARIEARILMLATGNWLSSSTGQPNLLPSQDMVLGFYYMTLEKYGYQKGRGSSFANHLDVLQAYETKTLELHSQIWIQQQVFKSSQSLEKKSTPGWSRTGKPPQSDPFSLCFQKQKFPRKLNLTSDSSGRLTSVIPHEKSMVEESFKQNSLSPKAAHPSLLSSDKQNLEKWSDFLLKKRFTREIHQPIEIRVNRSGTLTSIYPSFAWKEDKEKNIFSIALRTTPGRILFNSVFEKYMRRS